MSGTKAPEGYQPDIAPELVYDDQVAGAPPGRWHRLFAGGSNRYHFVRVDAAGEAHYVEQGGFDQYEAAGPGYNLECDTALDAFWTADAAIGSK